MNKKLKIGFFGFGCVGQGLYDILTKTAFDAEIIKICVKNKNKERSIASHHFTFDKDDILQNKDINLVVEMIDDANEAYQIVKYALQNGKNVVTANKKMLAEHLEELVAIQKKYGTSLLYEASACGSIPIIRNLEEYYDNELLKSVAGIFNGSSNYILSKIFQEKSTYQKALKEAQDLGFAESNPILDVGGFDAKFKLCIITTHAYGLFVNPDEVFNYGIQYLNEHDIRLSAEKNTKIKMIAFVGKKSDNEVISFVMPHFIFKKHELYHVENEYNGVIAEAAFADKQVFVGKGAGGHPTGAAVLSDISAMRYDYQYEYKKISKNKNLIYTRDATLELYVRYQNLEDLEGLHLENISVKHESNDFKYIIGEVNLENLYRLREELPQKNIFLVCLGLKK
ncbi:MAG: homoserine dehydrogenase [Cytophagales bacterium]|nr:MAG: homoserine dehydrogenase [Cytophagales bacterium]